MPTRSMRRDESGSILIPAAFTLTILIGLIGGAVDLIRASLIESKLQSALDNAALSASSLSNDQPVGQVISEYIMANLGDYEDQIDDFNIPTPVVDENDNLKEVMIRAEGKVPTFFLRAIGIDSLPIGVAVTAIQGQSNTEISLVLDISYSMRNQKIANLKTAAVAFVGEMLDDATAETTTINLVPYGGTVNVGTLFDHFAIGLGDPDVNLDPSEAQYGTADVTEQFRFTDGDGCIEYRQVEFDSEDIPPANSRSQLPDFWRFNNENRWCPYVTSSLLLNSNNPAALNTAIQNFTLSDGTGSEIGMLWGYRALSPNWRSLIGGDVIDRPADFDDEDTIKVIVWMSDGGTTAQIRPRNPEDIPADTQNRDNRRAISSRGANRQRLLAVCDQARDNDIIVFTIGFQITPGDFKEQDLQDCASSLGHYYLVEDLDIADAFESIASSIGVLRITN